jgi:hypothetical protein
VATRAMLRRIGAILAGLLAFVAVEATASIAARALWPAYDMAAPTRAYTLEMLLAREGAGMLCALAAGAAAASVSNGVRRTELESGIALLLIAVAYHLWIWDQYPVWYHLLFLSYLVPLSLLGGKLARTTIRGE